ncbi:MAG: CpsB/CapC family capsule biosynthesis tyrosine phosphatase [Eubacteriales bacterium]|nr:CpsB/CapC family capsule biosynthesis tyrosine phosphatase [Eubacteriales bacterium]
MEIIDFHSHILPSVDHGSDGIVTTISQLEKMSEAGVSAAVATPHFYAYNDSLSHFISKRDKGEKELSENTTGKYPKIFVGAEVLVCPGLYRFDGLDELCIRGTKTIMLEMPTNSWTAEIIDAVHGVSESGYNVVLAHIDRYKRDMADKMIRLGYNVQLNADSMNGFFLKRRLRRYALSGQVVAVGSDIHMRDSYEPFLKAMAQKGFDIPQIMEKSKVLLSGAISL